MPTKLTRGAALVVALAAGTFAGLSGAAYADQVSDGSGGIGSGNQINVPIDVAVDLCGNAVAVAGVSQAQCVQIAEEFASDSSGSNQSTDGSGGIASGNQINIPVDVAVSMCGNSIAVAGVSQAQCEQVAEQLSDDDGSSGSNQTSDGSGGIGSGNQVDVPVDADVNVCGNAVAILGAANAQCTIIAGGEDTTPPDDSDEDNGCDDNGDNGGRDCDDDGDNGENGKDEEECDPDNGNGKDECEEDNGNGGEECDEGNGEDCDESQKPEESDESDESDKDTDDKPADDAQAPSNGDSALPTTGSALYGLMIAALALVTFGGGAIYLARRRRGRAGVES